MLAAIVDIDFDNFWVGSSRSIGAFLFAEERFNRFGLMWCKMDRDTVQAGDYVFGERSLA